ISFLIDGLSFVAIALLLIGIPTACVVKKHESTKQGNPLENCPLLKGTSLIFGLTWLSTGTLFALEAGYAKIFLGASEAVIGYLFACATLGSFFAPYLGTHLKTRHELK